jgi:hypothetical protein
VRVALVLLLATGCRSLLGFEELAAPPIPDSTSPIGDSPRPDGGVDATPTGDVATDLTCPESYDLQLTDGASRYRLISQGAPWLTASSECAADGTHLIVLSTQAELSGINVIAGAGERWVGLSDLVTDGVFLPVTDEATTFPPASGMPWETGEPSAGDKSCVLMGDNGELSSKTCGLARPYICECDGIPNDPTNF